MSARIYQHGMAEQPRKTHETPVYVCQEWPEHISLSCKAIRQRRLNESCVVGSYPAARAAVAGRGL